MIVRTFCERGFRRTWFTVMGMNAVLTAFGAHASSLPEVPVPLENPITEEKRVLGKMLFWDEQLSSDNSVACGTCHRPAAGGADPRIAQHAGRDGRLGTEDDVVGSPGIRQLDVDGQPIPGTTHATQATDRAAPPYFMSLWAESVFWDGRAGPVFQDPDTGATMITHGGALENQALGPLLNSVEMAQQGRTWHDVVTKLQQVTPLALATDLPPDMAQTIATHANYGSLFTAAFGDPAITPARIALAIATYERTLVADQTPWDLLDTTEAGATAPGWLQGLTWFEHHQCNACHIPPLFTNNDFVNAGVRPAFMDQGRARLTGEDEDAGDMKVPSLRNVGLRKTFMHSGTLTTLDEVLDMYADPDAPPDPLPTTGESYVVRMTELARSRIKEFLNVGLTDPRVAAEKFPFDRPVLRSERHVEDRSAPNAPGAFRAQRTDGGIELTWAKPNDDTGTVDYVLERNGTVIALLTTTRFLDTEAGTLGLHRYRINARDAALNASSYVSVFVWPWRTLVVLGIVIAAVLIGVALIFQRSSRRDQHRRPVIEQG